MSEKQGMDKWGEAINRLTHKELGLGLVALEACRTKADFQSQFDSLGLPTYRRTILPLQKFLNDPHIVLEALSTPSLWYQLLATGQHKKRTMLDVPRDELMEGVKKLLAEDPAWDTILVSEYLDNKFGGNIVISHNNAVVIELGEGTHIDYARNIKTPAYFANNHTPSERMQYSFDNQDLRQAVWRVLQAVPHDTDAVRPLYLPGYYEFALVGDNLRPIFFDYRSSDIYQLQE